MPLITTQSAKGFGWGAAASAPSNLLAYDSIQTVTGIGSQSITFSSIPSTYKHLQIRMFWNPGSSSIDLAMTVNSSIPTEAHAFISTGTTPSAGNADYHGTYGWFIPIGNFNSSYNNYPTSAIIDLIDYTNTNKYKTGKMLVGSEYNSGDTKNRVGIKSAFWSTTSAISTITISQTAGSMSTGTSFALYGIKG